MPDTTQHKWLILAVGAVWLVFIHGLALHRWPDDTYELNFTRGPVNPAEFDRFEGWQQTPQGLTAVAGAPANLGIHFTKFRFHEVSLKVETAPEARGKLKVMMLLKPDTLPAEYIPAPTEGQQPPWLFYFGRPWENRDASSLVREGEPFDLSRIWSGGGSFVLFFEKVNDEFAGPVIRSITLQRELSLSAILLTLFFFPAVLVAIEFYRQAFPKYAFEKVIGGAVLLLTVLAWLTPAMLLQTMLQLGIALGAGALIVVLLRKKELSPEAMRHAVLVCVTLLTLLGANQRWDHFNRMRHARPEPDTASYVDSARQMRWFYDSHYREPLFVLAVKAALWFDDDSNTSVRALTCLFSTLMIPALFCAGREVFSTRVGLFACVLLASSPTWAWHGARALRLELYSLCLLILFAAIFTRHERTRLRQILWVGISAALTGLVRIFALWFCLVGAAYVIYRRGWKWKDFLITAGLTVAPVLPFLIYCTAKFGDPFYAINIHAKHFRNQEIKKQADEATQRHLEANPYSGEDVNATQFFFKNSPIELARRTANAASNLFVSGYGKTHFYDGVTAFQWWALVSFILIAFSPHWPILIWIGMLIGPIAWLFTSISGPEPRHLQHVVPVIYLCMAQALVTVFEYRISNREC